MLDAVLHRERADVRIEIGIGKQFVDRFRTMIGHEGVASIGCQVDSSPH